MCVAPLEIGGIVAGCTPEELETLKGYGRNIGLAFQVTDDLLDVAGTQTTVGKRVDKDAKNGKLTFPGVMGIETSRRYAEKLVTEACAMIEVFGARREPLVEVARLVLKRKR